MNEEAEALEKTLLWTAGMIAQSCAVDIERISSAYEDAQDLVARIPKDRGDARSRITACIVQSDIFRATDDVACVGWILTAIQERVNEADLPGWRRLRKVVNASIEMLRIMRIQH